MKPANKMFVSTDESYAKLFSEMKKELIKIDPVAFAETYLKLDGKPFKLTNNGWSFMADIYRYIALKATCPDGKPVVIVKGRQIGATIMAGVLDLYFTASGLYGNSPDKPPIRVMHLFPALEPARRFSQDQLDKLINNATNDYINQQKLAYNPRTGKVSSTMPDSMTLKRFKNGCDLWVESLGKDGDRIRGTSRDILLFDEVQNTTPQAIEVALPTLVAAKYGPAGKGVQVYFGTPKNKGSHFEKLWDETDKRYYFLGCVNKDCGHYFMLHTPGTEEWQKIWLFAQVVKCPKCGHEEDKRVLVENGKWIATEPTTRNGKPKEYVGYHINQLYAPHLDKNYILGKHPENNRVASERVYHNEVLGEFYSGVDMPILQDEIREKCADLDRSYASIITPSDRKTWMGIDWGGKPDNDNISSGMSYSCLVVISADSAGKLNVEFAYKLKSTDFQYKMDLVREMFKRYSIQVSVADFFYGQAECGELQKHYGSKFLSCMASGNIKKPVTYDKEALRLHWNKDYYIEEMFDLMRKGKVRFPWKSFEIMSWLVDHCSSMEVVHREVGGMPKKTYEKGATPNDGFMALIHAYLAYQFSMSQGFSLNMTNPEANKYPLPKLAHIPRLK